MLSGTHSNIPGNDVGKQSCGNHYSTALEQNVLKRCEMIRFRNGQCSACTDELSGAQSRDCSEQWSHIVLEELLAVECLCIGCLHFSALHIELLDFDQY